MKRFFVFILILFFLPLQAFGAENWTRIGSQVDNAFFFVVDAIIALQSYFTGVALKIGEIVLLIAVSSAAVNYALTGTGLKENIIKILKAAVFFFIVIAAYPKIVGGITNLTFTMAKDSIYKPVALYFAGVGNTYNYDFVDYSPAGRTHIQTTVTEILKQDNSQLFGSLLAERKNPRMNYTAVSPAAVFKIIFFLAHDCFSYADDADKKWYQVVPEFSRILKGLICAFVLIFTGIFGLLEYLVCFLEFMLVATVGVILFPFSLWDGSKFLAEKFIGAIVGFFMKLLFCTLAIFLLLYGFISLFNYLSAEGFTGSVDQIIFIMFVCLLFLFICKSAPGVAQSLLTGTPSLSASGAISAVGGAVAAAGAAVGAAQKVGRAGYGIGGNLAAAGQAAKTVGAMGGTKAQKAAAFFSSFNKSTNDSVKSSVSRSLFGLAKGRDPSTYQERKDKGMQHGMDYADKHGL